MWTINNGVYISKTRWSEVHYSYDEDCVIRNQVSGFHLIYKGESRFPKGTKTYDAFVMKFRMLEDGIKVNESFTSKIIGFYRRKPIEDIAAESNEWALYYMKYSPKTYRDVR